MVSRWWLTSRPSTSVTARSSSCSPSRLVTTTSSPRASSLTLSVPTGRPTRGPPATPTSPSWRPATSSSTTLCGPSRPTTSSVTSVVRSRTLWQRAVTIRLTSPPPVSSGLSGIGQTAVSPTGGLVRLRPTATPGSPLSTKVIWNLIPVSPS